MARRYLELYRRLDRAHRAAASRDAGCASDDLAP